MSKRKKILPMVFSPVKVYGCWPRSVARAPVDIVHSNHDQVKCRRRCFMDSCLVCFAESPRSGNVPSAVTVDSGRDIVSINRSGMRCRILLQI